MSPPERTNPTMHELANLLASLHVGEGIDRDRLQDSLDLERISYALCTLQESDGGPVAFPHLSETILASAHQQWPQADSRLACSTAFRLLERLVDTQPTPDNQRMLRTCHAILSSALHRVVRDHHHGILAPAIGVA